MGMKKTFSYLFIVLFLTSCGKSSEGNSSSAALSGEASDETPSAFINDSIPATFDVNVMMLNFSRTQEDKVLKASELIKKIVASKEFKRRVLNYTYNGKKRFVDNAGLTNKQIYERILEASEKMTNLGNNNTMDLELELYTDNSSSTIGYTYPNIVRVYMNRKYFDKFRAHQVADNMMHEWLHKIGFNHEVKATPSRKHSVPYAVGYIVKAMALRYMQ